MYLGLFLLPWALMYGVTAFLFNHPTAFSDVPMTFFTPDVARGTELETLPSPAEMAAAVVQELNERQKPATAYQLGDPQKARFVREFAFATVAADGQQVSVLVDIVNGGGTIRSNPTLPPKQTETAPFTFGAGSRSPGSRSVEKKARTKLTGTDDKERPGILLPNPVHERLKSAIPIILERKSFPSGRVTVTSVPDLAFPIEAGGITWTATYNPMTGMVTGKAADTPPEALTLRRFLLRLHTAHGYAGALDARWFWALIVDAVAAVLVFWGASGLLMWWQLKAARRVGFVVLVLSTLSASILTLGMHSTITN